MVDHTPIRKRPREPDDQPGVDQPTPNRRKTACQSCRLRKVKCDNSRPSCALCRAAGFSCTYLNSREKISLETATNSILDRLDALQRGVDRLDRRAHRSSNAAPAVTTPRFTAIDNNPPVLSHPTGSLESSEDFQEIPSPRNNADTVLNWEIFEGKFSENALINALFAAKREELFRDKPSSRSYEEGDPATISNLQPLNEERIPALVDLFLCNVHTKNPILDVESLVKHARSSAQHGVGWDAWSCMVLIACALGSIAKPFDMSMREEASTYTDAASGSAADVFAKELQQGETYFVLACRRLGGLTNTLLGAQCHFFAGVYLMYTLTPLQSYPHFYHASTLYDLYMKITHGISGSTPGSVEAVMQRSGATSQKQKRLEQSLFWSCFKSECEFRVELPLPQSHIATAQHQALFPSPPSPVEEELGDLQEKEISPLRRFNTTSSYGEEQIELRQHAKKLCNEEESWYYYLTEIALRRIGNRIINTFFRQGQASWLSIKPLLRIASEFDTQVSSWSANLPAVMRNYERTSTIRAPTFNLPANGSANHVSHELSWAVDNRLLEMRSWLYQPFLYYLVHSDDFRASSLLDSDGFTLPQSNLNDIRNLLNPNSETSPSDDVDVMSTGSLDVSLKGLDRNDTAILTKMITSGIACNLKILDVRTIRHRHHGLWFDLRSLVGASLILLAVVKSGHGSWIPGGAEILWGSPSDHPLGLRHTLGTGDIIRGKIGRAIQALDFWTSECPTLGRHRDVVLEVTRNVKSKYEEGCCG